MEIVQLLIIEFVRLISKITALMNVHFIGIIIILHIGMIINKITVQQTKHVNMHKIKMAMNYMF